MHIYKNFVVFTIGTKFIGSICNVFEGSLNLTVLDLTVMNKNEIIRIMFPFNLNNF